MQLGQLHICAKQLLQVRIANFHHNVELIKACKVVRLWEIIDPHNVLMVDLIQDGDFAQDAFTINEVIEHVVYPLYGDKPFFLSIKSFTYTAIRTSTYEL